ncbi:hypothetical protein WMY93_011837 [Mugilogobius chulae]|uniref:ribonuclease H n=1 Tax=Mugilogobius chulae TaxID=88201 RepID=A0AAW0P6W5_9GOBI
MCLCERERETKTDRQAGRQTDSEEQETEEMRSQSGKNVVLTYTEPLIVRSNGPQRILCHDGDSLILPHTDISTPGRTVTSIFATHDYTTSQMVAVVSPVFWKRCLQNELKQQEHDAKWEQDKLQQEDRWQSMERRVEQLQQEVKAEHPDLQPVLEGAAAAPVAVPVSPALGSGLVRIPSWKGPKMQPYQEDEDIEHYLTTFERIATACQWPHEEWALHLAPLLNGRARAAYVAMDITETMDYDKVKKAVLEKFEISAETYRVRFRSSVVREDESPKELQSRLKDLFDKWTTPREKTKEQIGDAIVLEQFLRMQTPDLRTWIKERNPTTSREAAELAEAFLSARRPFKSSFSTKPVQFLLQEVPQASTEFSPFQLLYGHVVRGPLDVLKEAWEAPNPEKPCNVLSYVLKMRDKLEQMQQLANIHLSQAQKKQKLNYDKAARRRSFREGQKVLLLLPTSECGLLAKWQGPYEVSRKVGPVTYELYMPDRRKKHQIFHINLLKEWNDRASSMQLWARAVAEEDECQELFFPSTKEEQTGPDLSHLSPDQQEELQYVMDPALFSTKPGCTDLIQHDIHLRDPNQQPIRDTTSRIPAKLIPAVKQEVEDMLAMGVIEPSKTFRVPSGLYQFKTMPFGLHGAPATFQRLVDEVLRGADSYSAAYIDDIVVFSESWNDHIKHLNDVFNRIERAGLVMNARKCHIAKTEVEYLGYIIGGGVIRPQTDASGVGLGAVLLQGEGEDQRPVQYISRNNTCRGSGSSSGTDKSSLSEATAKHKSGQPMARSTPLHHTQPCRTQPAAGTSETAPNPTVRITRRPRTTIRRLTLPSHTPSRPTGHSSRKLQSNPSITSQSSKRSKSSSKSNSSQIPTEAQDDCCVHCILACLFCEFLTLCNIVLDCATCGSCAGDDSCFCCCCASEECGDCDLPCDMDCGIIDACCESADCLEICMECCSLCFSS